jgi:hypothetical protein
VAEQANIPFIGAITISTTHHAVSLECVGMDVSDDARFWTSRGPKIVLIGSALQNLVRESCVAGSIPEPDFANF